MGNVIPIARRACPCGWEYPTQVLVVVSEPTRGAYSVRMTCPMCDAESDTRTERGEPREAQYPDCLADWGEAIGRMCDRAGK
jgi:hypothetical protein